MLKKIATILLTVVLSFSATFVGVGCGYQGPFTVTFLGGAEDATLFSGEQVQTVEDYTQLEPPTYVRKGYNFDGWTIVLNQIKSDTVVKAMWTRYDFNVTFEANGGKDYLGNTTVIKKVSSGSDIYDVVPKFQKEGYLLSWDTVFEPVNESCVITAVWTPKQYKVKFVDNQGNAVFDNNDQQIADGIVYYDSPIVELPVAKDKEVDGVTMRFTHWTDKSGLPFFNGAYCDKNNLNDDELVLVANWSYDEYVIDYDLNGGYTDFYITSYSTGEQVSIVGSQRKGYDFVGWTSEEIDEPQKYIEFDIDESGDKKFIANWQAKTYNLTLDYNGGYAEGENTIEVTFGQPVGQIKQPEREHYEFVGWTYGDSSEIITSETVWTEDLFDEGVLVAQYRKIYTLKFVLTTKYKKTPLECVVLSMGDLYKFGDNEIEEIEITIKEGETLSKYGIRTMPTVDPIEPSTGKPNGKLDDYYYNGHWKYVTKNAYGKEQITEVYGETMFNEENFNNVGEDGVVVIEPSCLSWYTN